MEARIIDMTGEQPRESIINMPDLPAWTMAAEIGYTPKTTFWEDFSIADLYGPPYSIIDTFKRAFKEWHSDAEYIAELSLVLNHKGTAFYVAAERHDGDEILTAISRLYFSLWEKLHEWVKENYTGADAEYYFKVTD